MSSAQSLREFIRERLTAAAAEIFSEFEQTIVRYEEEIDRQRRLLEISWKPQINLHRIELPLHDVRRDEEVLTDQQLWNQETTSSLDQEQPEPLQEEPEPPQMKVEQDESEPLQVLEQEELCMSQDEEQLVLKQETVTSLVTPADEDRDHHGPEPDRHQLLLSLLPEAETRAAAPPGSTELPQHHVLEKEEVLTDQQLSNQETTSDLNQKELQELCIGQREGLFTGKQENVFFKISSSEDTDSWEPELNMNQPLCHSFTEDENQDQDGRRNEYSEPNDNKRQQTKDHRDGVDSHKLKRHKVAHRDKQQFSCPFCGKPFSCKSFLTCHMRTHKGQKPYVCKTCNKDFASNSTLIKHIRTHTGEKPYPCKTCGKSFSQFGNLICHTRTHTGEKPYPCKTCGKCFSQIGNLTRHLRTHTREQPYPCKTCGKCFSQIGHLTTHMRMHTVNKPYQLPQHNVWEKEEVLTDQQLSNLETTSSLDQKEPEPPLIKEEHEELFFHQNEGQFILKQENVSFIVTTTHEEIENCEPEQSRNQSLCQSSTEAENQDQDGSRNENSEPTSNKELTWNKRRPQTKDHRDNLDSQKLKRHKRAHSDKRRFSCKLCGKSLIYKSLTCHMRTHTGEKSLRCKTCGTFFTQNSDLIRHMKTHTGEKPYPCKTCGKCFSRSDHLTTHMRTHTGEKSLRCKTCGKFFTQNSDLIRHMKTHTGEKPHPCKTCGKCFSRSDNLTTHMRTHTGEKPHPCKTCGKCFSRRSCLACHMKIHHR
nr:zinc finger protein ZFP2-like [Nothobranchius furzeri]